MIIECTQCGDRKYLPEPVSYSKVYICRNCRTVLILPKEEKGPTGEKRRNFIIAAQQAMLLLIITIVLASTLGTSVASAKSESKPATPLEGIVAVLAGAPADTNLIDNIQSVVAQYERSIVSESLQLMRIVEDVRDVSPVTEPTNDMALFPTPQNPLFPEYLNWKYSQFNYTVDKYGIVSLETDNLTGNTYH